MHWFGWGGRSWTQFDAAAEALGLTPDELFAELHDAGKTLAEIAEEQGVDVEAVQDALNANRSESMKQAIQQAVEEGRLSQEQADWLLEGLEKGFHPGGRGLGFGGGHMFGGGRGSGRGCW
jgi:lambda repressor-like predicted transcriptional regulator